MAEGNLPPQKNDLAIAERKIKALREISKKQRNLRLREKKILSDLNKILPRIGGGMAVLCSSTQKSQEELSHALHILEQDLKKVQTIMRNIHK